MTKRILAMSLIMTLIMSLMQGCSGKYIVTVTYPGEELIMPQFHTHHRGPLCDVQGYTNPFIEVWGWVDDGARVRTVADISGKFDFTFVLVPGLNEISAQVRSGDTVFTYSEWVRYYP